MKKRMATAFLGVFMLLSCIMPAMAAESQEMNDEDFDMAVAGAMTLTRRGQRMHLRSWMPP